MGSNRGSGIRDALYGNHGAAVLSSVDAYVAAVLCTILIVYTYIVLLCILYTNYLCGSAHHVPEVEVSTGEGACDRLDTLNPGGMAPAVAAARTTSFLFSFLVIVI